MIDFLGAKTMVTRTTNQLHFEDLDPIRFEELILAMVFRMRRWDNVALAMDMDSISAWICLISFFLIIPFTAGISYYRLASLI